MSKFLGGVVVGVFVGALAVEVLGRTHPELLEKVEERARRAANQLGDFMRRHRVAPYAASHHRVADDVY